MDDIYFSRKKNNGDEPKIPVQPDIKATPANDDSFHLNFAPGDRSKIESKISDSFSDAPRKPVRPSQYVPDDSYRKPVSQLSEQERRIPREVRESVSSEAPDYFESKYSKPLPVDNSHIDMPAQEPKKEVVRTPKKKKKKGKKRGFKVFVSLLLIILICVGSVGAYGYSVLNKLNYNTEGIEPNEYISASKLKHNSNVKNILFIGCDDAKGASYSRSDTMMLVSIDKANKAIKLTSFLRDSYLYIPAKDKKAKLNSACSAGGAQYVIDTLEYNFEVDIERYVLVDFEMFEDLVDVLGGVDVEISQKEADFLNKYCSFSGTFEGVNHLAGWQALTYCRIRHLKNETDFNRTERQRKVISSIIAKTKTANVLNLIPNIDKILANVETDIPKNELVSLGVGALVSYLKYDIMQLHIPAGECGDMWYYDTHNGESIIRLDVEANTAELQDFIFKRAPEDVSKTEE